MKTIVRFVLALLALSALGETATAQVTPRARIVVDGRMYPLRGNDDFAQLFNSVVRNGSRLVEVYGDLDVLGSLDLSNHRASTIFDFSGARLNAVMAGGVVMDMTRTTGATVRGRLVAYDSSAFTRSARCVIVRE